MGWSFFFGAQSLDDDVLSDDAGDVPLGRAPKANQLAETRLNRPSTAFYWPYYMAVLSRSGNIVLRDRERCIGVASMRSLEYSYVFWSPGLALACAT